MNRRRTMVAARASRSELRLASSLKKKLPLAVIAAELLRSRTPKGIATYWYDDALEAMAVWVDPSISELDRLEISTKAIDEFTARSEITADELEATILRVTAEFYSRPWKDYVVVTGLSIPYLPTMRPIHVEGWRLSFTSGFPRGFSRDAVPSAEVSKFYPQYNQFCHVKIAGKARSVAEAFENAIERLDVVRGSWNLYLNANVITEHGPRETQPINKIRPGPLYSLHSPDGKAASDIWRYEKWPTIEDRPARLRIHWPHLLEFERGVRKVLMEPGMGEEIRSLLVRYTRALDSGNADGVLLELWGVLEALTSTLDSRKEETIERCLFLWSADPMQKPSLELLRARRNAAAHSGGSGLRVRLACFRLHRHVANLLQFAMGASRRFAGLSELGEFLSSPTDAKLLKRDIQFRKWAMDYLHGDGIRLRRVVPKAKARM